MPKCKSKTKFLPATFAWILLLGKFILKIYLCQITLDNPHLSLITLRSRLKPPVLRIHLILMRIRTGNKWIRIQVMTISLLIFCLAYFHAKTWWTLCELWKFLIITLLVWVLRHKIFVDILTLGSGSVSPSFFCESESRRPKCGGS